MRRISCQSVTAAEHGKFILSIFPAGTEARPKKFKIAVRQSRKIQNIESYMKFRGGSNKDIGLFVRPEPPLPPVTVKEEEGFGKGERQ